DAPTPRLGPRPTRPGFFAAAPNVRLIVPAAHRVLHDGVVVPLVETEMLLRIGCGPHDPGVEQLADAGHIRHVRPGDRDGDRHAAAFGEDVALGPGLRAVGRVGPRFFPRPAGLCGATCRLTATSTRGSRRRHSTAGAGATSLPRCRGRPTAGSGDGPSSPTQTSAGPLSTGSRSGARRARRRGCAAAESKAVRASA